MLEPRTSWTIQRTIAMAAVLAMLVQCDIYDIWLFGPILMMLGWASAFCVGAFLIVDALVSKLRKRPAKHLWSALVFTIVVGPGAPFINTPFLWVSASHKLLRNRSGYLEAVARADAGIEAKEMYLIQEGPPRRYSFVWSGAGDDWWGILHDRSMTFGNSPVDEFDRDLVTRLHLWGPWYFVQYT